MTSRPLEWNETFTAFANSIARREPQRVSKLHLNAESAEKV